MINFTIYEEPTTKKNSQQIIKAGGRFRLIQSKAYREYEQKAIEWIPEELRCMKIDRPVNIAAIFYRGSARRVDLTNLLEALDDILVKAGVLEDDNFNIVLGHDGSRVLIDREMPRTEVVITDMEV